MRYPVINNKTGETKDVWLSCDEIMEWYDENPEWERDWTYGAGNLIGGVGEWKTTNVKKNPGWKDVLNKVREVPGNTLSKDNLY
jgi:hypothetical protein